MLDYLTAGALVAAPRLLGWDARVTRLLTSAGIGAVAYSLLTRYELGVVTVLPMPAHLAFDVGSGALLIAAPFTFMQHGGEGKGAALVSIGLFEITVATLTQTRSQSAT